MGFRVLKRQNNNTSKVVQVAQDMPGTHSQQSKQMMRVPGGNHYQAVTFIVASLPLLSLFSLSANDDAIGCSSSVIHSS